MSKASIKSKPSKTRSESHRRRKHQEPEKILKPFDFCCSLDKIDPLTKYNRKVQHKCSLTSACAINESPTLKLQTQFTGIVNPEIRKKNPKKPPLETGDAKHKGNINSKYRSQLYGSHVSEDLSDKRIDSKLQKPLNWYLENEIASGKDKLWDKKQKKYNEEMDKNTEIGKKKIQAQIQDKLDIYPRWYQDFSLKQMKDLGMLQCIMSKDCEEMVTGRTQRSLISIGITSTFFTLAPNVIKNLQQSSDCNVIEFLREIYKTLTGNYFEEEGYKNIYDCNERIILSAIAFLTLPEAIMELHKRLPPVIMPKLNLKPIPPAMPLRQKMESPYQEELFTRPNWVVYYNQLLDWQALRELTPIPNVILPPKDCILSDYKNGRNNLNNEETDRNKFENVPQSNQPVQAKNNSPDQVRQSRNASVKRKEEQSTPGDTKQKYDTPGTVEQKTTVKKSTNKPTGKHTYVPTKEVTSSIKSQGDKDSSNEDQDETLKEEIITDSIEEKEQKVKHDSEKSVALDIPPLYGENRLFDFTINGICEKAGPVEYKICGVLQPPKPNKKSWLNEKHAHYIISGASDEPPTCPVTYEMTGVANVTPSNSNERFFAVLKLGDGPNKIYPSGRKNLSRHWQEWLQNVDEEFRKVESDANKMIKSIEAITKLVFPQPTCDSCCSCRQTRKSYIKSKETKAPYFIIDTITEDDNKNQYIVGSMAMHSPAPTPPESTVNLLEIIASEDVLTTNLVISGVTHETGETQYFISDSKKEVIRVPARVVERPPPRPPRNVPPCVCAIQQIFSKGLSSTFSHDNIPWTKDEGLCFGKKFRPQESPAYSCKMYPGDKSCRRSPFISEVTRLQREVERKKQKEKEKADPSEKKMYSIADFPPCGDEHGMGVCGGPWGALHTLTPEELAEQERIRKEILKGPPCGTKPGRAVCEGPFGERIPLKPPQILIDDKSVAEEEVEEEEEEEEVEEEEEITKKEPEKEVKKKERKRDTKCYMSPGSIAAREQLVEKKVEKFIPDPNYPGYDDPWNIFRTAPSQKESETDFKTLLKLSSPKPSATPVQSKTVIDESEEPAPDKSISKSTLKKDTSRVTTASKQVSMSGQVSEKRIPGRSKSEVRSSKTKSRLKLDDEKQTESVKSKKPSSKGLTSDTKMEDKKIPKTGRSKSSQRVDAKPASSKDEKKEGQRLKDTETDRRSPTPVASGHSGIKSKEKPSTVSKTDRRSPTPVASGHSDIKSKEKPSTVSKTDRRSPTPVTSVHSGIKSKENPRDVSSVSIDKQEKKGKKAKPLSRKSDVETNIRQKKVSKQFNARKKSVKRDRRKDSQLDEDIDPETQHRNEILELKNMMKSSENYPYDIKPVELSEEYAAKCKIEYEDTEVSPASEQVKEDADMQLSSKGPCGWKTKSEQALPTKKTLVYLTDPDYPPERVEVRPGGKPCICRENRATKKILMYNIGGLVGGKKEDNDEKKLLRKKKDDDKKMQVIDGVLYYTPPPSPQRSEEYVPEYDLYESPYDMCLTKRKDENLKLIEQYGRPKVSKSPKDREACGCNEYIDTYGIQSIDENAEKAQALKEIDRTREMLINEKPPKERWNIALKDPGLIDYYTRCRDSMPCWLKCAKFNKVGCAIPNRKLKTKKPVCECKYERKVLEYKEEKVKWKERQKRLKSLKKQPYKNVTDISKPLVPNTKLMISNVQRIPRDDEYIDDIKYCISGVAENYSHLPPKEIVGGVSMATPIQTPEPSVEEIPCVCLHRHWSTTKVPPGPLPKPGEIMLAEKKRRQEAVIEAFREIYAPQPVYHTHEDHSCKEKCNEAEDNEGTTLKDGEFTQDDDNVTASRVQTSVADKSKLTQRSRQAKQHGKSTVDNPSTKTEIKREMMQKSPEIKTTNLSKESKDTNVKVQKASEIKRKRSLKEGKTEASGQSYSQTPQKSYNREVTGDKKVQGDTSELNAEEVDTSNEEEVDSDPIMAIVKIELKKMAEEGFLFAKLPKCFLMPQLRFWLMYRKGIVFSEEYRQKTVRNSIKLWNMLDILTSKTTVEPPSLKMTKLQLRKLTYDNVLETKEKIAKNKAIFYSEVRKNRVLYARSMWDSMEYGKFPTIWFKQAYFTYMASKESDGHVFKPWLPSEVREMQ